MQSNTLPELPRILNKREASVTPSVLKWFKANYPQSVALEIKATKTNSVPTSAVKDHQLKALLAVKSRGGLSHKLTDAGRIRQPMDAFILKNSKAFVVCCFLKQRVCLAIDPDDWCGAKPNSDCAFKFDL